MRSVSLFSVPKDNESFVFVMALPLCFEHTMYFENCTRWRSADRVWRTATECVFVCFVSSIPIDDQMRCDNLCVLCPALAANPCPTTAGPVPFVFGGVVSATTSSALSPSLCPSIAFDFVPFLSVFIGSFIIRIFLFLVPLERHSTPFVPYKRILALSVPLN